MSCKILTGRKEDGRPRKGRAFAYRAAYEAHHGVKLTPNTVIHHTCGNPACVNVEHLEATTQSEHMRAHGFGGDKNVGQALKTHCPAGHEYTEENTYRWRNERTCRTCRLATKRRFNKRRFRKC